MTDTNQFDVVEMDFLPISSSDSPPISRRKSVSLSKDYAIGIILLLVVVILWTASNFVTQVSDFVGSALVEVAQPIVFRNCLKGDLRNRFCELKRVSVPCPEVVLTFPLRVTYLNTSTFALYLVPFLIRRSWRYHGSGRYEEEVPQGRYVVCLSRNHLL
jgi:solute carrier family 35 protein F5